MAAPVVEGDVPAGWSSRWTEKVSNTRAQLVTALHRYGYPLRSLVRKDFKVRYGQTVVGLGWAVLYPMLLLLLYTFVFSVILQLKFRANGSVGNFALYLTCGLFPFFALSEGIQNASTSLTNNRSLLDKVLFPAEVLPVVGVLSAAVTEVVGLTLLVFLTIVLDVRLSAWVLLLPLLVAFRMAMTTGVAWLVSVLNVFFADIGQMLGLLLTAWMFLTPIFYPESMVPEGLRWALQINPLYHLVGAYRAVLLEARSPLSAFPYLIAWSVVALTIGLLFFRRTVERAKDFL